MKQEMEKPAHNASVSELMEKVRDKTIHDFICTHHTTEERAAIVKHCAICKINQLSQNLGEKREHNVTTSENQGHGLTVNRTTNKWEVVGGKLHCNGELIEFYPAGNDTEIANRAGNEAATWYWNLNNSGQERTVEQACIRAAQYALVWLKEESENRSPQIPSPLQTP